MSGPDTDPAVELSGAAVESAIPAVELSGAAVVRAGHTVWEDVDVTVAQGEFVAILGPNGAGKSTLLQVLLGLLTLSAGTARVLGAPPGTLNQHIGYLPQRHVFDAATRVRGVDVVRLGLDGRRWGVPLPFARAFSTVARARDAQVARLIELVGAGAYAHRPIGECSGGEQQRLLIAQALARHPRILVLDEPLDGLDIPNQAAIAALVQRICREERVTVLLVAHDVNPLAGYLDRVLYLACARAVIGAPEEVITSATLSELYQTQVEVLRSSSGQLVVVGQPDGAAHHGHHHHHDHVIQ
ncbi:MAG TPA: ATP-binding cassette domain-containing protein [Solirubrobacteraceae bacterium]|nr:ATP-binding cassette domain-containing protein [Solirubrobacteraceae bacterium]